MGLDPGALFVQHHEDLFAYLVRLTGGDEATARDAVQHAFLRLLERPPAPNNLRAWLYTVATNAVREWTRKEVRRAELVGRTGDPPGLGDAPVAPDVETERREAAVRLQVVLAGLNERDRTLLLMREEGFRHREIAEAVGTTPGSVGTLIARALRKAARLVAAEEGSS